MLKFIQIVSCLVFPVLIFFVYKEAGISTVISFVLLFIALQMLIKYIYDLAILIITRIEGIIFFLDEKLEGKDIKITDKKGE